MRSFALVMLAAVFAILFVVTPANAADKSVTLGVSGLLIVGLEYECGLTDSTSCCIVLGCTPFIADYGINLGLRWYNDDSLMDGKYYGLYIGYGEAELLFLERRLTTNTIVFMGF